MIAAAAQAGASFDEPRWTQLAKGSADFVLSKAKTDRGLLHIYAKGRAKGEGQLTDYAFLVWGLASLYEATFDVAYLRQAKSLAEDMIQAFWDSKLGGFHMVREGTEHLLARPKETYDGAIPSGNSVAAYVLARLARLTGDARLEETARKTVRAFGADLAQRPTASLGMVTARPAGRGSRGGCCGQAERPCDEGNARSVALDLLTSEGRASQDSLKLRRWQDSLRSLPTFLRKTANPPPTSAATLPANSRRPRRLRRGASC